MRPLALVLSAGLVLSGLVPAQAAPTAAASEQTRPEPFVRATAEEAVRTLATKLEDMFVFPDKGRAYAAMLRSNLAAGKYSNFSDGQAFAAAVSDDLQAVHKDAHLRVHIVPPDERAAAADEGSVAPPDMNGVAKTGWLADGVAYVGLTVFPGNEKTVAALRKFIADHSGAKTLIIDVRKHFGGGLEEMDILFPQLFAKPTSLVTMDTRQSVEEMNIDPDQNRPSLRPASAPSGVVRREHVVTPAAAPAFGDTKVYLLTSRRTASAGEHLTLSLKRTHRATLIGERTYGAGNYGLMAKLDAGATYAAFIPYGRTFDRDTGQGWETVGIQPDIAVPADEALDEALRLAGVEASGDVALAALK